MLRSHQWTLQEYKDGRYSEWITWAKSNMTWAGDNESGKVFMCSACGIKFDDKESIEECYHDCR